MICFSGKKGIQLEELKCKICGKLAKDDSHFYKLKQLCNRHCLQMYRYGKIISKEEILSKPNKTCGVCGYSANDYRFYVWHNKDEYQGKTVCSKHYFQLNKYGYITDELPPFRSSEKLCSVCGGNNKVKYSIKFKGLFCQRHYNQLYKFGEIYEKTIYDKNDYYTDKDDNSISYIIMRNRMNENIAEVIVDTEDIERIIKYKWAIGTWGYPNTKIDGNYVMLHRFILNEYDKDKIPDHINRNILDNRKSNLRIADKADNAANSKIFKNNTSGVKGVSWSKQANGWRAYITRHYQTHELGIFKDKEDAIRARLIAENKYFGEFASQKYLYDKYKIGGTK
jgi:hypothetical protein